MLQRTGPRLLIQDQVNKPQLIVNLLKFEKFSFNYSY